MARSNILLGDVRVNHIGSTVLRRRLDSLGVIVIVIIVIVIIIIIIASAALCA